MILYRLGVCSIGAQLQCDCYSGVKTNVNDLGRLVDGYTVKGKMCDSLWGSWKDRCHITCCIFALIYTKMYNYYLPIRIFYHTHLVLLHESCKVMFTGNYCHCSLFFVRHVCNSVVPIHYENKSYQFCPRDCFVLVVPHYVWSHCSAMHSNFTRKNIYAFSLLITTIIVFWTWCATSFFFQLLSTTVVSWIIVYNLHKMTNSW